MAFSDIITSVAEGLLVRSGVTSPTPQQVVTAELYAQSAIETIKHYRGLAITDDFEDEYTYLAIEMGAYQYQKQGVEGVTSFSENGVSRAYEVGSYPPSMLSRISLPVRTG